MTFPGALAGIVVGATTVLVWIYAPILIDGKSLSSFVYEIVPGVAFSSLAVVVVSMAGKEPSDSIKSMFDTMVQRVKSES